jgi:hypothetical protein
MQLRALHAMNFFERIPLRWLLIAAALGCLALWAAPSSAQTAGDPVVGKRLYENTADESGNNQLTGSCGGGGGVDNRRTLTDEQITDIAAYIADTPKLTSPDLVAIDVALR